MNSHELARELLKRRVNDVRIEILLDENELDEDITVQRVFLRDHPEEYAYQAYSEIVSYDSVADVIVIKAGLVIANVKDIE